MRLGFEEGRIIGCLIEKELTTPQQYPLTLNALVSACNQSSNRDPVVCYDDRAAKQALASLKDAGLVHFVHPSHGRSVLRYRHALDVRLGLDERRLALVAVLLLRGPQTAGELRARTERMATFDGIAAVDADLEHMSGGPEPVVVQLPRRPGQKEERWAELLTPSGIGDLEPGRTQLLTPGGLGHLELGDSAGGDTLARGDTLAGGAPDLAAGTFTSGPVGGVAQEFGHLLGTSHSREQTNEQPSALVDDIAALRAEVAALRAAVEHLYAELSL